MIQLTVTVADAEELGRNPIIPVALLNKPLTIVFTPPTETPLTVDTPGIVAVTPKSPLTLEPPMELTGRMSTDIEDVDV
jgi:hypothetical protein